MPAEDRHSGDTGLRPGGPIILPEVPHQLEPHQRLSILAGAGSPGPHTGSSWSRPGLAQQTAASPLTLGDGPRGHGVVCGGPAGLQQQGQQTGAASCHRPSCHHGARAAGRVGCSDRDAGRAERSPVCSRSGVSAQEGGRGGGRERVEEEPVEGISPSSG